jgi:predicted nuclease of predicted toxin-antitoxin system
MSPLRCQSAGASCSCCEMTFWVDAQLTPLLARWLREEFGVEAYAVRELGLQRAKDREIFDAARIANVVIITKDRDFVDLVIRLGSPPQILWLTCGNTSNAQLRRIFQARFADALALLEQGESIVEVSDAFG